MEKHFKNWNEKKKQGSPDMKMHYLIIILIIIIGLWIAYICLTVAIFVDRSFVDILIRKRSLYEMVVRIPWFTVS